MESEWKTCTKILVEILKNNDPDLYENIKSLKVDTLTDNKFYRITEVIMDKIQMTMNDKNISVSLFEKLFSDTNRVRCFRYILELIKNTHQVLLDIDMLYKQFLENKMDIYEELCKEIIKLKQCFDVYKNDYVGKNCERLGLIENLRNSSSILLRMLLFQKDLNNLSNDPQVEEVLLNFLDLGWIISEYPMRIVIKGTNSQKGRRFQVTIGYLMKLESNTPINIQIKPNSVIIQPYMVPIEEFNNMQLTETLQLNDKYKIQYSEVKSEGLSWNIKNMLWTPDQTKSGRNVDQRISDHKSIILFRIKCTYLIMSRQPFKQINRIIWLNSDPTIVTVHANQEIEAQITLFWNDYIGNSNNIVTMEQLIQYFDNKILYDTGRKLTNYNIDYLINRLKILTNENQISFEGFKRTIMTDSFSIGVWLFSIIKLIKCRGIIELWKNNLIIGFCNKDCYDLFNQFNNKDGVCLLRFSEKSPKIGIIVKGFVNSSIIAWEPYKLEELEKMYLSDDLIKFTGQLKWILVDDDEHLNCIDFNEVISKYVSNDNPTYGYTRRGNISNSIADILYNDDLNLELSPINDSMVFDANTDIIIDDLDDFLT